MKVEENRAEAAEEEEEETAPVAAVTPKRLEIGSYKIKNT